MRLTNLELSHEDLEVGLELEAVPSAAKTVPFIVRCLLEYAGNIDINLLRSAINETLATGTTSLSESLESVRATMQACANYFEEPLRNDALAWAEGIVDKQPAMALRICESPAGRSSMERTLAIALHSAGQGKGVLFDKKRRKFKTDEKHFIKLITQHRSGIRALEQAGYSDDHPRAVHVLANHLFGGLRVLILGALADQYILIHKYVFGVACGAVDDIADAYEAIVADQVDVLLDIMHYSSMLKRLGPPVPVALFCDVQGAAGYALDRQDTLSVLANLRDDLVRLHESANRATRAARAVETNAAAQAKKHELAMAKIREGRDKELGVDQYRQRIELLEQTVAKLKGQLAERDERLLRLAGQASAPANDVPVVPPPIDTPPPAPVVTYTAEEDKALLSGLRILLVGGHTNFTTKVKAMLPDWVICPTEDEVVDERLVRGMDAVVFFTAHCSHKLTEKVLRECRQLDVPALYATRVNPPAFLREVAALARAQGLSV